MAGENVTVVSGLPRSGTSLMMQMLAAGGMPVLADGVRGADEDNPRGYLEFEAVKRLRDGGAWLDQAAGKAVKVVSALLGDLPATHSYDVIFMLRPLDEVLASQQAMLVRRGEKEHGPGDAAMRAHFAAHLAQARAWLDKQPNFRVLYCQYGEILRAPEAGAHRVAAFLDRQLDTAAMAHAVDPTLYRNRSDAHTNPGTGPATERRTIH